MSGKKFIYINKSFLIKDKIGKKKLNQSILFILNKSNLKKSFINDAIKRHKIVEINLPKYFDTDIIFKTKLNKDLKFINLKDSKIFNKKEAFSIFFLKKIQDFKLNKIKFFPRTYLYKGMIFQQMAKGYFFRPNKFKDFNESLFKDLAKVINIFSSLNNKNIKVNRFIQKFKNQNLKDDLNFKILSTCILILKRKIKSSMKLSLTHGDLKFEHMYFLNNKLEYVVDWENVGIRSVYFDIFNFFTPWFAKRSYKYKILKKFILNFIDYYTPKLSKNLRNSFDFYFAAFALERYIRLHQGRTKEFNMNAAYKRYFFLFNKLINEIVSEY
tara:strand:- start:325 stop:1305 length:981 start_codon:yes stop_codon:yes gene_type:complete